MKFTLLVTQECNLACTYCYISKHPSKMKIGTAVKIIDFIFSAARKNETNSIAFFGGEPLLEFQLIKEITALIENHPKYRDFKIEMSIISNGTVFNDEIADFLIEHDIKYALSCDGPAHVQDKCRVFKNGSGSSHIVENTIRQALNKLPLVIVNAVYTPQTLSYLPQTVEYLMGLGLHKIHLNADYSAAWKQEDEAVLENVLGEIGGIYVDAYNRNKPVFISPINGKITLIINGGYKPSERCHMGKKEFAFSAEGNIFPCERIIENGRSDNKHCIGNIDNGVDLSRLSCNMHGKSKQNNECSDCGIKDYCMNWCGCSNYLSTGYYNRVGAFLCGEEKIALKAAMNVFEILEKDHKFEFYDHILSVSNPSSEK